MGGRIVSYLVANNAMRVWQRHWFKWQHCSGNRLAVEPLARPQAWTIRGNRLLAAPQEGTHLTPYTFVPGRDRQEGEDYHNDRWVTAYL
jgi:hypothetical protein